MELDELVEIVDAMVLQHAYPGYDARGLKLGLPDRANNAPAKLFAKALGAESIFVRLAALRWFWERPGVAKRFLPLIARQLHHEDEWIRLEASRAIGRVDHVDENFVIELSALLADPCLEVQKVAAQSLGKLGCQNEIIINRLHKAAETSPREVKWKAEKALRKLGQYIGDGRIPID